MNGLIIGLSYFLSGFFMKLSDDEYDEKSKDWFCHKYNVYDKPKEKLLRKIMA